MASFLLIFSIFAFLQARVRAIERAAERRTGLLRELRDVKARQLSGDIRDEAEVDRAVAAYRQAYEQVENLRTVIPGIARIPSPPSDSLGRARMVENDVAAQQFLGISSVDESSVGSTDRDEKRQEEGLSTGVSAILAFVLASQLFLLGLLSLDAMSANEFLDSLSSVIDLE